MKTNSYKFVLIALALLTSEMPGFGQAANNYTFFNGDTLKGFDLNQCLSNAVTARITSSDMKGYIWKQERAFVLNKYPSQGSLTKPASIPPSITASCNNLDFESGSFTGWTGYTGENDNSNQSLAVTTLGITTLGINSSETSCSYHTLVSTGTDPYGLFPMLDQNGGSFACRLGGENANWNNTCNTPVSFASPGESLQQTFTVSASNPMFTYRYAVVLERPTVGHTNTQCPYFRAEVLDSAGNPIPGFQFYVESDTSATPSGMMTVPNLNANGDYVDYLPWQSNSIDLKLYVGHPVTVRFTAAGCALGGHMGYAYIDASCAPVQIATTSTNCQGGTITLTAPEASQSGSYQWSTVPPGNPGIVGSSTGQSVNVNANGKYQVLITPQGGTSYSLDTTITFYALPVPVMSHVDASCGTCTDGSASVATSGGATPYTYSWSGGTIPTGQGTSVVTGLTPGTYTCCVTSANGCMVCQTATVAFTTGISALQIASGFSVSPNPFTNTLKIETGTAIKDAQLVLYDMIGKEILHRDKVSGTVEWDLSGLAQGVYFLALKTNQGTSVKRVVKD